MINKKTAEILAKRRSNAEITAKKNIKLLENYPHIQKLYQEEQKLIIEKAKCKAYGTNFDETLLKNASFNLENALKEIGLTKANLKPEYHCKSCSDTGTINGQICDCVKKIESKLSLKTNNRQHLKTFAEVDYSFFENPDIKKIYEIVEKFSKVDSSKYVFITLSGPTGVGKTFLLECAANEFIARNKSVLIQTAFNLNNDFLNFHISQNKNSLDLIQKYLSPDVLLIDDLGSEPFYKNVTQKYLFLVLDERTRDKKTTIITTNLAPDEIRDVYGDRCFSRIINKKQNLFLSMQNSDIRLKKLT